MLQYKLPTKEVMLERLEKANDGANFKKDFYPRLAEHAERTVTPDRIAEIFEETITKYRRSLPKHMVAGMYRLVKEVWIDAIVTNSAAIASQAKRIFHNLYV